MLINSEQAIDLLLEGKVVAVPTETVYGLAGIATNPSAVARIFEIKNRPADNPLICHFHSIDQIRNYVMEVSNNTLLLMQKFSPGPVSFMFDLPENSPLTFATCGRSTVIARIPDHKLFLFILQRVNQPIAAPSANTSGKISPTSAEMAEDDLGERIDGVVDGGLSKVGLESAILDARNNDEVFILRPGIVGEKEIHSVLPKLQIIIPHRRSQVTPGSKYRHYAPTTPVVRIQSINEVLNEKDAAILVTDEMRSSITDDRMKQLQQQNISLLNLGSQSDLQTIAKQFYQILFRLDSLNLKKAFLLTGDWGSSSLGKAISNRLEKIISN